ncbi:hypothetical protein D3C84_1234800 [compost metagenome]
MGNGLAGYWINNVGITLAVLLKVIAITTGSADAVAMQIHQCLHCIFAVGGFLDCYAPGVALAV